METIEQKSQGMIANFSKLAETLPIYFYVPIAYLTLIGLFISAFYLGEYLGLPDTDYSKLGIPENLWFRYLMVALLGPIVETFVFQAMPYYFLNLFEFLLFFF